MRYHINNEGKIYPCRAKINACKYGDGMHGNSKEELYAKALSMNKTAEPSKHCGHIMHETAFISTKTMTPIGAVATECLSEELETHPAPIEFLQATWEKVANNCHKITYKEKDGLDGYSKNLVNEAIQTSAVYLANGGTVDHLKRVVSSIIVSDAIKRKNEQKIKSEKRWGTFSNPCQTQYDWLYKNSEDIKKAETSIHEYLNQPKSSGDDTKEYVADLANDRFQYYSQLLNVSKMISQPILEVDATNPEAIKAKMKSLSTEALYTIYEEYTLSDTEVANSIKSLNEQYTKITTPLANRTMVTDFEYVNDNTISPAANANIKRWYNRNQIVWRKYKAEAVTRISLSLYAFRELKDRKETPGDRLRKDIMPGEVGMSWK